MGQDDWAGAMASPLEAAASKAVAEGQLCRLSGVAVAPTATREPPAHLNPPDSRGAGQSLQRVKGSEQVGLPWILPRPKPAEAEQLARILCLDRL